MNLERSYITAARNGWDYSCCVKLNRAAAAATLQYVNVDIADPRHEEGLPMYYHPCTPKYTVAHSTFAALPFGHSTLVRAGSTALSDTCNSREPRYGYA